MRDGPDCAELSTLLNEIDVPRYEAVVITDLSTESGTILLNGLPKDAPLTISAYLPARMVTLILSRQAQDSVPPLFEPRIAAGRILVSRCFRLDSSRWHNLGWNSATGAQSSSFGNNHRPAGKALTLSEIRGASSHRSLPEIERKSTCF